MCESTNHQNSDKRLETLQLLWEEYKYRHDLVWRVIFQLTTAIVVLSIIPYIKQGYCSGLGMGNPICAITLDCTNNLWVLSHKERVGCIS
ncbi:hypothetical protein BH18ACI4_BH18ACI4_01590 [soil metagenome]